MTEATNSPTKPNEPACAECSRLASRVEELEKLVGRMVSAVESLEGTPIQYSIGMELAAAIKDAKQVIAKHSGSLSHADSASNTQSSSTAKETR